MNMISTGYKSLLALFLVLFTGCASSPSKFVVVDQMEEASVTFSGIPRNIDAKTFEEIKRDVSEEEKWTLLTWEQFLENVDEYAQSVILRNDYTNVRVVDGIVCLMASQKGAGASWGLTWNSGIALTRNDYNHARKTYYLRKIQLPISQY
jgi:hypothetical protein